MQSSDHFVDASKEEIVKLEQESFSDEELMKDPLAIEKVVESADPETETDLNSHMEDTTEKYLNKFCLQTTNLRKLLPSQTLVKPFQCYFCGSKFLLDSHLSQHMLVHRGQAVTSGQNLFQCELCDYKCSKKGRFKIHMRKHNGEKPFQCELCDYKCSVKSNLGNHMLTHTGERPFRCEVCDFKFSRKASLRIHMWTHTGEKPFACEQCEYKCSVKSELKQHMRKHTGEKPFHCELCDYRCSVKIHLQYHIRSHTGEKPYRCDLCGFKYSLKSSLVRHLRTNCRENSI